MVDEDRRQDGIRLRAVEEAVIEFKTIAKTVIVDHHKRLDGHDDDIQELKNAIYQSCDAKSKEVDEKDDKVKRDLLKVISVACVIGLGIAGLGLAAVLSFNEAQINSHADIASINTKIDMLIEQNKKDKQ